eukprot:7106102-Prymnesium_polylepis.1
MRARARESERNARAPVGCSPPRRAQLGLLQSKPPQHEPSRGSRPRNPRGAPIELYRRKARAVSKAHETAECQLGQWVALDADTISTSPSR